MSVVDRRPALILCPLMNCEECKNLIGVFLESDLEATLAADVRMHLATCGDCAVVCEEVASIIDIVADGPKDIVPPNSQALWCRINNIIESEMKPTAPPPEAEPQRGRFWRLSFGQLTAAVVHNWNAYIAHVGDSRAYLFRQGVIQQLTQDHMQRQPAELATIVAMEQQEAPPLRDVLTRAIGKADGIDPQVFGVPLTPGDKLLLTSDGLTNTIPAHEIVTILNGNTAYAAELLIRRAIEMEAKDNITAAVVECLADAYVDDVWEAVPSERVFTAPARGRSLKMRKPGDPVTHVNPSPMGCFMFLTIILIVMIAYWIIAR